MKFKQIVKTILTGTILLAGSQFAMANSADQDKVAKGGTIVCSGNFNETTGHRSRWILHNIDDTSSFAVTRIRVYDAAGTSILDTDTHAGGVPSSGTPVLPSNVGPMQTLFYKSEDLAAAGVLPGNLAGSLRPVKVFINWASTTRSRMLVPYVLLTRPGPGSGRHARDCRSINFQ